MKRIGLLLILLLALPAAAQTDALLLYTTREDGTQTARVLNVDTGEETTIAELVDAPGYYWGDVGWSPDGRYLWVVDTPNQTQRRLRLFEAGTWSERVITDRLLLDGCFPAIFWAAGGQSLSYITGAEPDYQLALLNLATDSTYTFDHLSSPQSSWPRVSPDGRYLVARIRPDTNQRANILVDTADGSLITSFDGIFREFSPDSRFLAYYDQHTWLYDLSAGEVIDLATATALEHWSPDGRYLLTRLSEGKAETLFQIFDLQTRLSQPLDVGELIYGIDGWLPGSSEVFILTYDDDSGQTLLRYSLATGDITPILETTGHVMGLVTDGPWLVILHTLNEQWGYEPSTHIRFSQGQTVLDEELVIYGSIFTSARAVAWSPDGRWLMLWADDGLYRFDPQTAALERLPVEAQRFDVPMWSADGRYLVFHAYPDQASERRDTMVWNTVTDTITPLPYPVGTIIGWQNGEAQDSLLYCGIGG